MSNSDWKDGTSYVKAEVFKFIRMKMDEYRDDPKIVEVLKNLREKVSDIKT